MIQESTSASVMERLKSSTQHLHDSAEHHPVQRALFKGRLPREAYVTMLGQLLLVHNALETALRSLMTHRQALSAIVEPWQFQTPYLQADLAHFGVDASVIRPLPATTRLLESIRTAADERPFALLGMHYVVEGSNNGSRFSAMAVRRAYNLAPGHGDRYLDPYGELQRERWQAFKTSMMAGAFTPQDTEQLLEGAQDMFRGILGMSDDLLPHLAPTAPTSA